MEHHERDKARRDPTALVKGAIWVLWLLVVVIVQGFAPIWVAFLVAIFMFGVGILANAHIGPSTSKETDASMNGDAIAKKDSEKRS